jgi:hypothetical protein
LYSLSSFCFIILFWRVAIDDHWQVNALIAEWNEAKLAKQKAAQEKSPSSPSTTLSTATAVASSSSSSSSSSTDGAMSHAEKPATSLTRNDMQIDNNDVDAQTRTTTTASVSGDSSSATMATASARHVSDEQQLRATPVDDSTARSVDAVAGESTQVDLPTRSQTTIDDSEPSSTAMKIDTASNAATTSSTTITTTKKPTPTVERAARVLKSSEPLVAQEAAELPDDFYDGNCVRCRRRCVVTCLLLHSCSDAGRSCERCSVW